MLQTARHDEVVRVIVGPPVAAAAVRYALDQPSGPWVNELVVSPGHHRTCR